MWRIVYFKKYMVDRSHQADQLVNEGHSLWLYTRMWCLHLLPDKGTLALS